MRQVFWGVQRWYDGLVVSLVYLFVCVVVYNAVGSLL